MADYSNTYLIDSDENNFIAQSYQNPLEENIYIFMDNAYSGTGGFFDGTYLVPHSRETEYDTRRERVYYRNFFRSVVKAMLTPVYNEDPDRKLGDRDPDTDPYLGLFLDDADNRGHDLCSRLEQAVKNMRLHGVSFLVMDNFTRDEQPRRLVEALNKRAIPYIYAKKRHQVERYKIDGFGRIKSIIFHDAPVLSSGDGKEEARFRGWDDTNCTIYSKNDDGELVVEEEIPHGLGEVPVLMLYSAEDEESVNPMKTHPPLYDLARMNWAIYNNDSWIEEIKADQGCAILYAPGDKPRAGIELGTKNAWYMGPDPAFPPGFIAPPAELLTALRAEVEALRSDFYRIAEQNGVSGVVDSASGVSKQWDFQAHGWVLSRTASITAAAELWCVRMLGLYVKADYSTYTVKYKSDFEPQDETDELKNLDRAVLMDIGQTGNREVRKRAADIVLRQYISPEALQRVHEDIDAATFDQRQAGFMGEGA